MIPTCLLAWAAVGHGVTLLQYDNLSGKLTVQQVSYFPVSSLEYPGTSEYFPYEKGDSRRLTQTLSQSDHDFALIWHHMLGMGVGAVLHKTVSLQAQTRSRVSVFWYLWPTEFRVTPMIPHFLFFMPLYNLYPLYVCEICDCFYPTEYGKEMDISSVIALQSVKLHLSNKLTLPTYLADLMKWPCW